MNTAQTEIPNSHISTRDEEHVLLASLLVAVAKYTTVSDEGVRTNQA